MSNLHTLLQQADRDNPNSSASVAWMVSVERSVSRARVRRKITSTGSIVLAAMVFFFGGTTSIAQGVEPDHPLYPVKLFSEQVVIRLIPTDQRSFATRHLIDRRVEEIKQRPELTEIVRPNLVRLVALQERTIMNEPLKRAIPETISQAVMFQQDIERLRILEQTRDLALTLATLNQRLLATMTAVSEQPTLAVPKTTTDPKLLYIMPNTFSTPTPDEIRPLLKQYNTLEQTLRTSNPQDIHLILTLLQTKNTLHIRLISSPN